MRRDRRTSARVCWLLLLLAAACNMFPGGGRRAFRSDEWKSATLDGENPVRCRMVDDLIENHLRRGMTRQQVIDLLGPAEQVPRGAGRPTQNSFIVYTLGRCPMSIDFDELRLDLDRAGRLERSWQVQG